MNARNVCGQSPSGVRRRSRLAGRRGTRAAFDRRVPAGSIGRAVRGRSGRLALAARRASDSRPQPCAAPASRADSRQGAGLCSPAWRGQPLAPHCGRSTARAQLRSPQCSWSVPGRQTRSRGRLGARGPPAGVPPAEWSARRSTALRVAEALLTCCGAARRSTAQQSIAQGGARQILPPLPVPRDPPARAGAPGRAARGVHSCGAPRVGVDRAALVVARGSPGVCFFRSQSKRVLRDSTRRVILRLACPARRWAFGSHTQAITSLPRPNTGVARRGGNAAVQDHSSWTSRWSFSSLATYAVASAALMPPWSAAIPARAAVTSLPIAVAPHT